LRAYLLWKLYEKDEKHPQFLIFLNNFSLLIFTLFLLLKLYFDNGFVYFQIKITS